MIDSIRIDHIDSIFYVWIEGHLHLRVATKRLLGVHTWYETGTDQWCIEFTFDSCATITTEYDSFEKFLAIVEGLERALDDGLTRADYEKTLQDYRRLVRDIDVIMHGNDAAKQASLCDLVGPIKCLVERNRELRALLRL